MATSDKNVYSNADVIIVSINCDLKKGTSKKEVELDQFSKSVLEICELMDREALLMIESTVPPGTCQEIIYPMMKKTFKKRGLNEKNILLAHSYERVMPGEGYLYSIINFWRVYSGINKKSADKCEEFLSTFINTTEYPLTRLKNTISTETSKLLENSYRAVNIAFIQEWSNFAEKVNIDLYDVINAIRMRPTHSNIRQPGFGVGGYCLTKDPLFAEIASNQILNLKNVEFPFSKLAVKINNRMPLKVLEMLSNYFGSELANKRLLMMGATYKEGVADTRFSASETFYKEAIKLGLEIDVYDPLILYWEELKIKTKTKIPPLNSYDIILFCVSHKEFSSINPGKDQNEKETIIFDANNVLTRDQVEKFKSNKRFKYISLGRG